MLGAMDLRHSGFGTSPIQAEKLRPDRKTFGSATLAAKAVANSGHVGPASENLHMSRHMECSKKHLYSITSFARNRNASGIVSLSAFAVVRLMMKSNLVGCSTGRSAGLAPRRILSTYSAARRNMVG